MSGRGRTRRLLYISFLVSSGLLLHIVEGMLGGLGTPVVVPGAKLGLANIVTLVAIVLLGMREALWVVALRSLLGSLLGGNFLTVGFYMSFGGGVVSAFFMGLVYIRFPRLFSLIGISVLGAVIHNLTQLVIFYIWAGHFGVFFYAPYLTLIAIPTGFFVGLVTIYITRYLRGAPSEGTK